VSDLSYLDGGLLRDGRLREDLVEPGRRVATAWLRAGISAATVEIIAEQLARWAELLAQQHVAAGELLAVVGELTPARGVAELVRTAVPGGATRLELGALAVHLLDVAEAMALQTYVPELPSLHARSDLSGDAARNVGLARHLKG
jgi:hypothetical protein